MYLNKYKQLFKERHIAHRVVAGYIGCTREHLTMILNGRNVPDKKAKHIEVEFRELLGLPKRRSLISKIRFWFGICDCGGHVSRKLTGYSKKAECDKCHTVYNVNSF